MATKDVLTAFREELRERRLEREWSQESLAEKGGLHRNYIGLLERGERNPTLSTLESLAKAFKTKASEFLYAVEKRMK